MDSVPIQYCDPSWYYSPSPYYNASHHRVKDAVRSWVSHHIPEEKIAQWDHPTEYRVPPSLVTEAAKAGILPPLVHGFEHLLPPDEVLVGGVKVRDWDLFHTLVVMDEIARVGSAGVVWNLNGGLSIGLPPVIHYGSAEMKERVAMPCIRGEKRICLAITEPLAGSDVAGLQTTAALSSDGTHYVVNGVKKWITGGMFADYFTTAVRTEKGVSILVIPRGEGVRTRAMQTMGGWGSGTAFVEFDDAKVPVSHLLGEDGFGLMLLFLNFNPERYEERESKRFRTEEMSYLTIIR